MKNIITLTTTLLLSFFCTILSIAQTHSETEKNTSIAYFFKEKYVLASNSPFFNHSESYAYLSRMRYENSLGKSEENLNGKFRTAIPESFMMSNPLNNEDALEYEILAAKMMGVDGFKFEFNLLGTEAYVENYVQVVSLYTKVVKERNLDFNLTLELNFLKNEKVTNKQLLSILEKRLNYLLKVTTNNNIWLKTENNELIVFTKGIENILEKNRKKNITTLTTEDVKMIANEIHVLKSNLSEKIAIVYQTNTVEKDVVSEVIKAFPAITLSSSVAVNKEAVSTLRKECLRMNKVYVPSVFIDKQNTQLYNALDNTMIDAQSNEISDLYIKGDDHKMTQTFRDGLEDIIQNNDKVVMVNSWNNFEEGSHLAREIHHGYALGVILKYYKAQWLNKEHIIEEELISTAFRNLFLDDLEKGNVKIQFDNKFYGGTAIDSIEIVTILKEEGEVFYNKKHIGTASSGITSFYTSKSEGEVNVIVKRNKKEVLSYTSLKNIEGVKVVPDYMVYITSNLDTKYAKYNQNVVLDRKLKNMRNRFLLDNEKQNLWRTAERVRFFADREALFLYASNASKYYAIKKKNYKKYASSIKSILGAFQYEIWEELEEETRNNEGIESIFTDENEVLKDFNNLEAFDF